MSRYDFTRRGFLGSAAAASLALGTGLPARAAGVTIGFIYVGPKDDFGWNQAHAVGAKAIKDLPGVKVLEEENVPETDAGIAVLYRFAAFDPFARSTYFGISLDLGQFERFRWRFLCTVRTLAFLEAACTRARWRSSRG